LVGKYDEAMISYENIQPGEYAYRFSNVPKSYPDCTYGKTESKLKESIYRFEQNVSRREILSPPGSETAVIRLTSQLPEKVLSHIELTIDDCGEPMRLDQRLAMQLAPKPSTNWKTLKVKNAKNLIFRIPVESYEKSRFELILKK
jgi:hypothetical protein